MIVVHKEYLTGSTVSGSLALNTQILSGIAREIIVSPATSTTIYNLTITDDNSFTIFSSDSVTGDFIEEVALAFRGVYTFTIDSATKDEAFTIQINVEE